MTHHDEDLLERAAEAASILDRIGDDLRVRAHLAGMEARDTWDALQPHLRHIEQSLRGRTLSARTTGDEAALQLHLGLMDARDRWMAIEETVHGLFEEIEHTGGVTRARLDHARVQAHLARLEAREVVEARLNRARERLDDWGESATGRVAEALEALIERLEVLVRRIDAGTHGSSRPGHHA